MMKMKKKYIAPQAEIVGGIYDICILAGSGNGGAGTTIGGGGDGGNQEKDGNTGSTGGENVFLGAKNHFNAWTAWED